MGILRTDRVTGLGGANAIKGSVFFGGKGSIEGPSSDDFKFCAGGDFTVEAWVNANEFANAATIAACWDQTGATSGEGGDSWLFNISTSGVLQLAWSPYGTSDYFITGGTLTIDTWHHVALTRSGNTFRIFLDGTQTATGTNSSSNNTNTTLTIGSYSRTVSNYYWHGYISNVRILKGEALYTSTFTPPTRELTVIENTVFLGCQSPGDITQDATGKDLIGTRSSTNDAFPVATTFTPNSPVGFSTTTDVGTQFGTTFNDVTTFNSQAYMVLPGGNTRERNRGRGLIGQGSNTTSPSNVKAISFIEIQSGGTAFDFGDSTNGSMYAMTAVSSSTRAVFAGGHTSQSSPYPTTNLMEFVTIANTSKCTNFGDLDVAAANRTGVSNQTRGLIAGGYSPNTRQIDKITIATAGDAGDFGDLSDQGFYGLNQGGMISSTTRGLFAGGSGNSAPVAVNTITFVLIASDSNSTDFGDLTHTNGYFNVGNSNGVRGVFMGGADIDSPYAVTDQIDFVTIATAGNATDFGSLKTGRYAAMGASNSTRGVIAGGRTSPTPSLPATDDMEYITIASAGNGVAFGELIEAERSGAGCSDSHGGLE